jgi:predicted nucleic-acid-binding protein
LHGKPYEFSREEIGKTIEMMLQCTVFELENCSVVYQALHRFQQGRADFSDYLIGATLQRSRYANAQQLGCSKTVTFDGNLKDDKGFKLLER